MQRNIVALAHWLIRWDKMRPVEEGFIKNSHPYKMIFINGLVFEFPKRNVVKQINIRAFWLDLEVTLQQISKKYGKVYNAKVVETPEQIKQRTRYIS